MANDEEDVQVGLAYAKVMDTLRALPWQVREGVCGRLRYNDEFCWDCGMDKDPPGSTCHCTNDE